MHHRGSHQTSNNLEDEYYVTLCNHFTGSQIGIQNKDFLHVLIVIRLCCEETVHSNLCLCGSANRSSGLNKAYIIILIFIILFTIICIIIIFETIIIIIIVKCIDWIRFPVTKTREGRFFSNFRGFPVKENDELV